MEKIPSEEIRFKTNVLDLIALVHDLATICWNAGKRDVNPALIPFAENYLESYDPVGLIEIYIEHSHKHWQEIKDHNEVFFLENAHTIFNQLPINSNHIDAFKVFFTAKDSQGEDIIIQEDRDAIWEIFESLVKICLKFIHKKRKVELRSTDKGLRPVYTIKYFPQIPIMKLAKVWNVDLPIPGKQ